MTTPRTIPVAVLGASGYAGGELIRLLDEHPRFSIVHLGAHSRAGRRLGKVHPALAGGDRVLGTLDPDAVVLSGAEMAFLALPHGASAVPAMALLADGLRVVDLGSDFRLDTPERYREAYGVEHPFPEELGRWSYGLPELFGEEIAGGDRVAAPGCYPTSAILAVAPLLAAGLVEPDVIVDSLSGVSGAGRGVREDLQFAAVDESARAYGVLEHRHRPEMERALDALAGPPVRVAFTPHLVPMARGILTTCWLRMRAHATREELVEALRTAYAKAPFVMVQDEPPATGWVVGSNRCLLAVRLDRRTGTAVVLSAIDNLLKGAAGQGIQCANLMYGLDERTGLPVAGWLP